MNAEQTSKPSLFAARRDPKPLHRGKPAVFPSPISLRKGLAGASGAIGQLKIGQLTEEG